MSRQRLLKSFSRAGRIAFAPRWGALAAAGLLIWSGGAAHAGSEPTRPRRPSPAAAQREGIRLGNQAFLRTPPEALKGKRLGLVVNHTSLLSDGTPLYEALQGTGMPIAALFAPEHGFDGQTEGGLTITGGSVQKVPVISLYGRSRRPQPEHVRMVDAFVYDIQDVGTRFYTYISTLKYVMEAAARAGLPVYVLDRPNPLGGEIIEGPILRSAHESFIGSVPVPVRYGLTIGELALMMRGEGWVPRGLELHIIRMENWRRGDLWPETGLTWIPTSPNIPTADTALIYPGTGLLGGVILNQGLGTPHPFLLIGAPWMNPDAVIAALPKTSAAGLSLEPAEFTPRAIPGKVSEPPYADRGCRGFRLGFTDRAAARPVAFTLELIRVLKQLYPERIYTESRSLTLMYGTDDLEKYLKGEVTYQALLRRGREDVDRFRGQRAPYLLYE